MKHNCTVLVSSCDAYSDLWPPFFNLFKKNWPDCPYKILLITEEIESGIDQIYSLKLGKDMDWSSLLMKALDKIETEYVLFFLEDFFLRKRVDNELISRLLIDMQDNSFNMLRLVSRPKPDVRLEFFNNLGSIEVNSPYRVSTQAAIWKVDVLRKLIKKGESAWDFEIQGSKRSHQFNKFIGVYSDNLPYRHHVIERGKWFPWEAKYFKRMEIGCDFTKREIMSLSESLLWLSRKLFSYITPIRNLRRFIGKNFGK